MQILEPLSRRRQQRRRLFQAFGDSLSLDGIAVIVRQVALAPQRVQYHPGLVGQAHAQRQRLDIRVW